MFNYTVINVGQDRRRGECLRMCLNSKDLMPVLKEKGGCPTGLIGVCTDEGEDDDGVVSSRESLSEIWCPETGV